MHPKRSSHARATHPDSSTPAERSKGRREGTPNTLCTPTHRDEGPVGISAATKSCGYTLALVKGKARVAEAAFSASGMGIVACAPAEAFWVRAGRRAGGQAVGVEAVGRALQSCGKKGRCPEGPKKQRPQKPCWAE